MNLCVSSDKRSAIHSALKRDDSGGAASQPAARKRMSLEALCVVQTGVKDYMMVRCSSTTPREGSTIELCVF